MSKRKMNIPERVCERCGETYKPHGTAQKYCDTCRPAIAKATKYRHYRKNHPLPKPPRKYTEVCCVCGKPFEVSFKGKPYCNKHYLRMYLNGTPELQGRKNTCTFDIDGDVLTITTAKGEKILADASDYDKLKKHSWCISHNRYPVANVNGKVTRLHRYILGLTDPKEIIDHKNNNPLDNRRCNLRRCTPKDNARNCKLSKNSSTGVTGVKKTASGRYSARIMVDRKAIHLGTFDTLDEAAHKRLVAEITYFGEFAPVFN